MMADLPTVIGLGFSAFVASNIDDLFILMFFFANCRFPVFHIVLGQYVGMGLLLAVSLIGSLITFVIPSNLIGLLGLFPIAIGIKEFLESRRKIHRNNNSNEDELPSDKKVSDNRWITVLPFLTVTSITFSGSEEIGIYTSIFSTNNEAWQIISIILVSMVMTGIWCVIASSLLKHRYLADLIGKISRRVLPFILIGLGIYILVDSFAF